ncbi:MAG: hypothetical protein PHE03_10275 [Bacteroidales bacterium]|nr:hypothetical protein [Bacteroidales bacterium]
MKKIFIALLLFLPIMIFGQTLESLYNEIKVLQEHNEGLNHRIDELQKMVDDVLWFNRMDNFAHVDKVYLYGPPPANVPNPTAKGAFNPVKFWAYVFVPKGIDLARKHPLLVLPHGGVHGDFTTYYYHIIRELMVQGYIVVAPEY